MHPMTEITKEQYVKIDSTPWLEPDQSFSVLDVTVYADGEMHGGGSAYGQWFPRVLETLYTGKKFKNCFEWCSGPGFIGFSLLAHELIENLYLHDVYKPALYACQHTKKNLPSRLKNSIVETFHSEDISILSSDLKFDLIVSNPPHWDWTINPYAATIASHRICADDGWQIHKRFFDRIKLHLNDDGIILLQEATWSSGPDTFRSMIDNNGLEISRCFHVKQEPNYYFLEVRHKKG